MTPEALMPAALALPAAGALLIALAGRRPNLREAVTLTTAGALFLCVALLVAPVLAGERPEISLLEILPGLALVLALEPLGLLFALIAALLWIVNSVYSIGYLRANRERHQTRFYACFAVSLAATTGIAFAGNLLTLFVFYEILTLATYPLVTHRGTAQAVRGGRVYLGLLLSTSIGLLLLAILWTWHLAGTLDFTAGGILAGRASPEVAGLLLFLYAFGIGKAALMPLHRWLPAAMVAPTPVSALLHAVAVVKAGVFAIVKVIVYVFGVDVLAGLPAGQWLLYVAGTSVVAASVIALRQDNLKLRLAYSTVAQLSYVVMAAAILAPLSIVAAAMHIAAHAFGKITLFFAAGAIYTASHKTRVSELDGIGRRMPWTMGAFAVGALSMIGVPPTVGFVSKWYILLAAMDSAQAVAVLVLVAGTLLSAAYYLPIVHAAFFRAPAAPRGAAHGEAPWPMVAATAGCALLTILLFWNPDLPLALASALTRDRP
jgi:multicomponent Na+:H+ antiporter subunit D